MKRIMLTVSVAVLLMSCGSSKEATSSSLTNMAASQLLSTLTSDSSIDEITKLFRLLDTNNDNSITENEAVGDVLANFGVLDTDSSGGIDLAEMAGLLTLLK